MTIKEIEAFVEEQARKYAKAEIDSRLANEANHATEFYRGMKEQAIDIAKFINSTPYKNHK